LLKSAPRGARGKGTMADEEAEQGALGSARGRRSASDPEPCGFETATFSRASHAQLESTDPAVTLERVCILDGDRLSPAIPTGGVQLFARRLVDPEGRA
jgi:hypothetical protein